MRVLVRQQYFSFMCCLNYNSGVQIVSVWSLRYMCDPELRQFYEDEVQRFISINKAYLTQDIRIMNGIKSIFQDLLNDKPHRVDDYVKHFFSENYRFEPEQSCGDMRRRKKLWRKSDRKSVEDVEQTSKKYT